MNSQERLAFVITALESVGILCLVMGGHAVRFYGLARNTDDFDLHVSANVWDDLAAKLEGTMLFPDCIAVEGDSRRPDAFRRFRIGALADGRDEWLEFWKANHLLAPYPELMTRSETGLYGGRSVRFLGLEDLIRSKETERDKDWRDVAVLEQILDARALAGVATGAIDVAQALSSLRSRTGFESFLQKGLLADTSAVTSVLAKTSTPVTQAFLIPFSPDAPKCDPVCPMELVVVERLQKTVPASSMHLALVEIVRRRYISFRKDNDRRNKEATRSRQIAP